MFLAYTSIHVILEIIVQNTNLVTKLIKLRNNQIISKNLDDKWQIQLDHGFELIKCQCDALQRSAGFGLEFVELGYDCFESRICFWSNTSALNFLRLHISHIEKLQNEKILFTILIKKLFVIKKIGRDILLPQGMCELKLCFPHFDTRQRALPRTWHYKKNLT